MVKVAVNFTASEMASKLHFYCHKEMIKKPKVMHFQFLLCFPGWRCKVFRRQPILFGSCGRGNTGSGLFATGAVPADSFWLVLSRSLPHMSPPHSPSFVLVRADHKGVYKFKMDVQKGDQTSKCCPGGCTYVTANKKVPEKARTENNFFFLRCSSKLFFLQLCMIDYSTRYL